MAYNPNANIVISGKTFMDVPSVQFKTPDGATVNFAHVGGSIRFSPTLEEQTNNVENFSNAIIDPITSTLLNQLDSDFVAENIKKGVNLFGLLGTMEAGGGGGINLGDYFTNIIVASITPAEDMIIGNGVVAALNFSSVRDIKGTVFVIANNEYRKSISNNYVRLAFYPYFVFAGIWRILYGTGTAPNNEQWGNNANTSGGSTYRLKAGIKYEVVYIKAPY